MVEKETTVVVETSEEGAVVTEHSALITKGTNGFDDFTVTVGEVAYNAVKVGTGSLGGDCTITVGAGATKLSFYAAAWKGVSGLSLNLSGATAGTDSFSLSAEATFTGSNKSFTLAEETVTAYKFETTLSDIEEETVIKLETSIAKRFIIWNASYSIA